MQKIPKEIWASRQISTYLVGELLVRPQKSVREDVGMMMTLNEQETMTKLDRAYPDVSILRVLPARAWRAVVADDQARGRLVEVRHLALVEPIGEPEERRVVAVIEHDGRAVLHPGVVALVATVDGIDLSDLGQGVWGACDPRVGEGTALDPIG